jgi:hypothetical protein
MTKWVVFVLAVLLVPYAIFAAEDDWMMKAKKGKQPVMRMSQPQEASTSMMKRPAGLNDPLSSGVPSSVNPYDAYKVGEVMYVIDTWGYQTAIAGSNKEKMKEHRDLLVKAGFSEKSLAAYDKYSACMADYPFTTPWNQWSADQQNKWSKVGCGWTDMWGSLKADWQGNQQALNFLWLGFNAMRIGWDVPKAINEDGYKIAEEMSVIKSGINDFVWWRDGAYFKNLTPDVQAAVQTIAGFKSKLGGDPLAGEEITAADVAKMADAAKIIRQAAKDQKLVAG